MTEKQLREIEAMVENGEKLIGEVAFEFLVKEISAVIKTKANIKHTHTADDVTETTDKKWTSPTEKDTWNKKVSQEELQNAIKDITSGMRFRGVFATLEEAKTQITAPKEGDYIITTTGKNNLYIYEAETINDWQSLGDLFIPGLATQTTDGLMSKTDKKKLDGLQNYTHPETHPAAMITEDDEHKFVTATEKANIATALSTANTAKGTADSALQKAGNNETEITELSGKVTANEIEIKNLKNELDTKFNFMTEQEAQEIINKYKA